LLIVVAVANDDIGGSPGLPVGLVLTLRSEPTRAMKAHSIPFNDKGARSRDPQARGATPLAFAVPIDTGVEPGGGAFPASPHFSTRKNIEHAATFIHHSGTKSHDY
jgi:hypothetical protein